MKRILNLCLVTLFATLYVATPANAQFWKKTKDAVTKSAKAVATTTADVATDMVHPTAIAWDSIPLYEIKACPVVNEDGTTTNRYFLYDQFGRQRSPEAVKAMQKAVSKLVVRILAKTGTTAAVGVLTGGTAGLAAGAAAGAIISIEDITEATKLKKSLVKQKKLLKEYEKNFSAEGLPIDAQADLSNYTVDEKSMTAEEVAELVNSEDFKNADESAYDF